MNNLCDGLTHGFHTGVSSLPTSSLECRNNLSARINENVVSELLELEFKNNYVVGPFSVPPFHIYRINPLGVAEHKY